MNIFKLSEMSEEKKQFILKRAELDISEQMKVAKEVSDDIRVRGDAAVLAYTEKFDHVKLDAAHMKVTAEEIEAGYAACDPKTREAIEYAAKIFTISTRSSSRRRCGSQIGRGADGRRKDDTNRRCVPVRAAREGELPIGSANARRAGGGRRCGENCRCNPAERAGRRGRCDTGGGENYRHHGNL